MRMLPLCATLAMLSISVSSGSSFSRMLLVLQAGRGGGGAASPVSSEVPFSRYAYRVRFDDCDVGGMMFNAHYFAYCHDAFEQFLLDRVPSRVRSELLKWWEVRLKKTTGTFHAPLRLHSSFFVDVRVSRWGKSSFDVEFRFVEGGLSQETAKDTAKETEAEAETVVFEALSVYVSVDKGSGKSVATPAEVQQYLSGTI
uniref:Thioesterase domain-containing protein n=1 Tax=Chromera velia CCMP2878 TaxID=1169474 RepID=A0A0G4HD26_9ALVE|eukprot:Cvel_26236.t1-p1 / transcript=Cvel_26236.t1 / gene=Cvel_26236 / organism=Chromera_velia_CCMP2878 / gene_product=hypothetical protein / transcript_product=hypothetical protein / location=Cvel_scaffold3093:7499-8092(-) / protein_length=198 / sequence_SO=supercontig / SO=protein_coding / is_pseudo=false